MFSWVAMDRMVEAERASDAAYRRQGANKVLRSDAGRLTDDELVAKLLSFGIEMDRPTLERLCDQAREVFRVVEQDPRDLGRARTFLSVYLLGLRDATAKFAEIWPRSRDPEARAAYVDLLGDLETSFATHRSQLLLDDRSDLDIEIEVLRERLKQDGLVARQ